MKKLIFLIPVAFIFFIGCDKIDDLLTFIVSDKTTIQIDNQALNLPFEIATPDITSSASQEFQNNNTKADLVKDVKLIQLRLSILSPQGKTFSFLKKVEIFISTDANDKIRVAYLDNIPSNATTIDLIPTTEKLDKYLKASTYNLTTTITTRETLTQSVDVEAALKFKVTADPL